MITADLAVELAQVEALAPEWDALAIACEAPVASPAWALAWWHHVAPAGAALRVVAVREHGRLIGLVPLYVEIGRRSRTVSYRLLASSYASALTPLAAPGRECDVAAVTARLLDLAEPRPDRVELGPVPAFSPWAAMLREYWPGRMRPAAYRTRFQPVPVITVEGRSFEDWLQERPRAVRRNARNRRRRFTELGGTYRYATAATLEADLRAYVELHASRWQGRGRSRYLALGERLVPFFAAVANPLLAHERFRLLMVELEGTPICADISLSAGGEIATVTAGWDQRYRELGPARLALLQSVESACERRERRIDLGWGNVDDKQQYANALHAVVWDSLLVPGARLARTLPSAVPTAANRRLRQSAKRILSAEALDRLRSLRDR